MKRRPSNPPCAYSVGDPVLVKLLLPPHAEGRTALVRGEVLEVLREFCHGVPLRAPVYRVRLFLGRTYHPRLAPPGLQPVELEPASLAPEGPEEAQCLNLVKCCWPDQAAPLPPGAGEFVSPGLGFDLALYAGMLPAVQVYCAPPEV